MDKIIHDIICDHDHVQYIYLDMHKKLRTVILCEIIINYMRIK